jgi:hypothetical protein
MKRLLLLFISSTINASKLRTEARVPIRNASTDCIGSVVFRSSNFVNPVADCPMPFRIFFKPGRGETLLSRMKRARGEGYSRGYWRGRLFTLAVGEGFKREQALDWLDNVIEEGREERYDQHASGREAEAWDMSCPIAFLLEIAPGQ